jgi:hypothetical protein
VRAGSKDCFTFITISISDVKMQRAETQIKALLHDFDHPKFGFLEIVLSVRGRHVIDYHIAHIVFDLFSFGRCDHFRFIRRVF